MQCACLEEQILPQMHVLSNTKWMVYYNGILKEISVAANSKGAIYLKKENLKGIKRNTVTTASMYCKTMARSKTREAVAEIS